MARLAERRASEVEEAMGGGIWLGVPAGRGAPIVWACMAQKLALGMGAN